MATDAASLASQGSCYLCYGAMTLAQAEELALLATISQGVRSTNDVSPQGLLTQGACYGCFGNMSIFGIMKAVLLAQINAG